MRKIIFTAVFTALIFLRLDAGEIFTSYIIVDNEPKKTEWVKKSETNWAYISYFEKGKLTTYFKKGPEGTELKVMRGNMPTKQEFEYYPLEKTFTSQRCLFEKWPDGAKGFSFLYEIRRSSKNDVFDLVTTAIIKEVKQTENQVRYMLYKGQ